MYNKVNLILNYRFIKQLVSACYFKTVYKTIFQISKYDDDNVKVNTQDWVIYGEQVEMLCLPFFIYARNFPALKYKCAFILCKKAFLLDE